MKNVYFIILGLVVFLISCGPSKEEIAIREKFIADSIAQVEVQKEKERIHLEYIEVGKSVKKTKLTKILNQVNSNLEKEEKELSRIKEFQVGRSATTKQKQLDQQYKKVQDIKSFISKVEKEISLMNLFNSFDFQLTPEGVIEHIFSSAKSGDHSKIRYLIDPYGECDDDTFGLCLVEMYPEEVQKEWDDNFKNGRIMGEVIITDDKATVEVAIGESSDELEKIHLVQRMDKWYIISL